MLLKEWQKWREDGEEDRSSYWMILRKLEKTANWKRNHCIALCELTLEEAMDLSYGRSRLYKVDSLRNLRGQQRRKFESELRGKMCGRNAVKSAWRKCITSLQRALLHVMLLEWCDGYAARMREIICVRNWGQSLNVDIWVWFVM
jgi:hypothetical protein